MRVKKQPNPTNSNFFDKEIFLHFQNLGINKWIKIKLPINHLIDL